MKGRIPKVVHDAVKEYSVQMKLPAGQVPILMDLALKSYKSTPIERRNQWTLEAILNQDL